jgi:tetratricopeptide (TPR) repeat protein
MSAAPAGDDPSDTIIMALAEMTRANAFTQLNQYDDALRYIRRAKKWFENLCHRQEQSAFDRFARAVLLEAMIRDHRGEWAEADALYEQGIGTLSSLAFDRGRGDLVEALQAARQAHDNSRSKRPKGRWGRIRWQIRQLLSAIS